MKSYPNLTLDNVLHDLSYQNLVLLSSIIPSYDFDKKGRKGKPGRQQMGAAPQRGNAGGLKGLFSTLKGE